MSRSHHRDSLQPMEEQGRGIRSLQSHQREECEELSQVRLRERQGKGRRMDSERGRERVEVREKEMERECVIPSEGRAF